MLFRRHATKPSIWSLDRKRCHLNPVWYVSMSDQWRKYCKIVWKRWLLLCILIMVYSKEEFFMAWLFHKDPQYCTVILYDVSYQSIQVLQVCFQWIFLERTLNYPCARQGIVKKAIRFDMWGRAVHHLISVCKESFLGCTKLYL